VPSSDPELVIRQALRAQAGGPRRPAPSGTASLEPGERGGWLGRVTATQNVLLADNAGLVIGMAAGFAVLHAG
jgi:hypothetical protein